jgi:hypothetical protein
MRITWKSRPAGEHSARTGMLYWLEWHRHFGGVHPARTIADPVSFTELLSLESGFGRCARGGEAARGRW